MSDTTDARKAAADARERLADTLDQIEDRVNIPRKVGELTKRAQDAYEKDPKPFIAGAVGAVAAIAGIIVWAVSARRS